MTDSNDANFVHQRSTLLHRVNSNARAVMEGLWDNIKKPYKPTRAPARPNDPEWKRLMGLQDKFIRWVAERKACKTVEAREELNYSIIMECRRDFPKIAVREFEEPDLPESMKPMKPYDSEEPEEPAQPDPPTLPVANPVVAAAPLQTPATQVPPVQATTQQVHSARPQPTILPSRSNQVSLLSDPEEDDDFPSSSTRGNRRKKIKHERGDDDYEPLHSDRLESSPPPPSEAAAPKRKRQRAEDFASLVRSEDPAELRYLLKVIENKYERQKMQVERQLRRVGAGMEDGNEG